MKIFGFDVGRMSRGKGPLQGCCSCKQSVEDSKVGFGVPAQEENSSSFLALAIGLFVVFLFAQDGLQLLGSSNPPVSASRWLRVTGAN